MPYKLLSYQAGRAARAGMLVGDTVYDAAKGTGVAAHASVLGILEDWGRARRRRLFRPPAAPRARRGLR